MYRPRISRLAAFALLSLARPANAAEARPTARIESSRDAGAEACISNAALVRAVERRLRRPVFRDDRSDLVVRVHFDRSDAGFRVRLELADSQGLLGTRELATPAAHCSALDDSLALVVALLVDTPPERETPVAPVSQAPSTPSARAPIAPRRPATPILVPRETFAPRESASLGARACATVAYGLLPGLAPGLELGLEAKLARIPRITLLASGFLSRRESLAGRDAGATLSLQRLGLFLCPEIGGWSGVVLEACAGQYVGRLTADGFGFSRNLGSEELSFALGFGPDLRVGTAEWLDIVLGVRAEFPLTRHEFTGRTAQGETVAVFAPPVIAFAVQSGLGVHF